MSDVIDPDTLIDAIAAGDPRAFALWVAAAEPRVRLSLRSFAASVDVEVVVQETLLRIWQVAPRFRWDGEPDGLTRLAVRIARNLAIGELRRRRPGVMDLDALERAEATELPEPQPIDPEFRAAVGACLDALPPKPKAAMDARLRHPGMRDQKLARALEMATNTFVQNVGRARRALMECLRSKGLLGGLLGGSPAEDPR